MMWFNMFISPSKRRLHMINITMPQKSISIFNLCIIRTSEHLHPFYWKSLTHFLQICWPLAWTFSNIALLGCPWVALLPSWTQFWRVNASLRSFHLCPDGHKPTYPCADTNSFFSQYTMLLTSSLASTASSSSIGNILRGLWPNSANCRIHHHQFEQRKSLPWSIC